MDNLPRLALSVRQPWAWAIIHGGKVIENRSMGAIRAGRMTTGTICIHAASGMKEDEYRWAHWRLAKHGVTCPRPEDLVRSAIIGTVKVTEIITASDSEWFGGAAGLVLADPRPVGPVPASGQLGYFKWQPGGTIAPPKPWMKRFDINRGDTRTLPLFPDAEPSYKTPPAKPVRKG
ncbi:hypothetical protein [Roseobacter ponti]|uniref:ASCH domain-containing protein n=1 Tax=Roseobacter ponti TaxID=1891787 RepID=A0A858SQF2_9RHOB|nr:hypothetical protein [Roseobacter ponti]QJF49923.1 hypothetical protein G3256_01430 [Roseobacter ponti]